MLRLAIVATLLAAAARVPAKPTSTDIVDRPRFANSREEYHEKGTRESEGNRPEDEGGSYPYEESTAGELAAAVGHRDVVYQDTGNSVNEQPRQSIGDGWRDAVPGTPGMDYPNLDRIPVTSFTCADKEPGGYYADAETGCQVFHVCNTGGVKSSFLCPPGSIFNQRHFVCDWWYGFNCDDAVDLYFRKSAENLEIPKEDRSHEESENSAKHDGNIEAREDFDSLSESYPYEGSIRTEKPTNDLSFAGSGRGTVDHPNPANNRMVQLSPNSDSTEVNVIDSKNPSNHNHITNNESAPRGFSRNDNESLHRKKLDRRTNSHDLTNDLASYVNYFEDNYNNNSNNNNNNNYSDNNDRNRENHEADEADSNESLENDTSLVDKYVYGERTRSGYISSGEA